MDTKNYGWAARRACEAHFQIPHGRYIRGGTHNPSHWPGILCTQKKLGASCGRDLLLANDNASADRREKGLPRPKLLFGRVRSCRYHHLRRFHVARVTQVAYVLRSSSPGSVVQCFNLPPGAQWVVGSNPGAGNVF